ncbi:MAG: MaoC family dehydratase [Pseudomonadota bacterium]
MTTRDTGPSPATPTSAAPQTQSGNPSTVADDLVHHEDYAVGDTGTFGDYLVTRDEIKTFARHFDPQPQHLDEVAAAAFMTKGLCASGFHSCAIMMRLLCDGMLLRAASLGSPGMEEVRWKAPVYPDDRLHVRYTVTGMRTLRSRPHVGLMTMAFDMVRADGTVVMSWHNVTQMMRRRTLDAGLDEPSGTAAVPPKPVKAPAPAPAPSLSAADAPRDQALSNWFEDLVVGEVMALGSHTFTADETIAFARQFDPQPFHLDTSAAEASLFGKLSASGWHTAAVFISKMVAFRQDIEARMTDAGLKIASWGPSPGFKDLRWIKPVLVGDTITFTGMRSAKRDLKSRPTHGLVLTECVGHNQDGVHVFSITTQMLVERRTPNEPAA